MQYTNQMYMVFSSSHVFSMLVVDIVICSITYPAALLHIH